jgi:hypothetical protein
MRTANTEVAERTFVRYSSTTFALGPLRGHHPSDVPVKTNDRSVFSRIFRLILFLCKENKFPRRVSIITTVTEHDATILKRQYITIYTTQ